MVRTHGSYVFRVTILELGVSYKIVLNSTYIRYNTLLVLLNKFRLTLTLPDHSVSSLSHCKCAIKVNVETNSRIPYNRAKYHDINLSMWCYILHIRAWCLGIYYSTSRFRLMMMCIINTKLNLLGFYWIFIVWLDPYMKFDFDMQMHVAISSPYLVL
jgi:hypothetical protein